MNYNVVKRSGKKVTFNADKITHAILKAMRSVSQESPIDAKKISKSVVEILKKEFFNKNRTPTVEKIQDIVEKELINFNLPDIAKSYILYRDLHNRVRNINNLIDTSKLTNDYIEQNDWEVNENSSVSYSLAGLYNYVYGRIAKTYWLNEIYPKDIRELNENNDFHIHKLSALSVYCVGWDLMDLLLHGFGGVAGKLTSSPPKHFATALGQLTNFFYTLTTEAPEGASAISNFDTFLAPFIRYDKLDYKTVYQELQIFLFNMNCPTKVGAQAPFTNVTLDLKCPSYLKDQPVVINGKLQSNNYGCFQKEMDTFNKAFAKIMMKGDAAGNPFPYPIPTYNIAKDFDWENPVYEPIWEMTAKYGIPYFANFVNSDMNPDDVRSMCCRLRIDNRQLQKRGGGLFGANPLTGSIGYVTINLPKLGYTFKKDLSSLHNRLDYLMSRAAESLYIKRRVLENLTEKGLYPYSKHYLREIKTKTGEYWSNHFNTIGIIGMNECCLNFFGKDLTTQKGQRFSIKMLNYINMKLLKFQKESGQMFNLEASPAEGTTYRFALSDKQDFPEIIVANNKEYQEGAAPYYTNSTHLPVGFTDDIFEALDLQDELQCKYTGGTVFHGFLGERLKQTSTTRNLVRKIAQNYKLPYFTITPSFSICPEHGYITGKHHKCPKCPKNCIVYSRVVGKIHPVQWWNPGKKNEFGDRKTYAMTAKLSSEK
ncbi:MAG: ribonucleoside triphosphate reductase [Patescibacteria group bacterium]|nr:ribonucleoside triphosphate reductase [Patescibacteria group bacterium]